MKIFTFNEKIMQKCVKYVKYVLTIDREVLKLYLSKKGDIFMTLYMNDYIDFIAERMALIIIDIILVLRGLILR